MTPRTVNVVCAKSKLPCVPAIRLPIHYIGATDYEWIWECSYCGARVKVVA